jgi:CheY-like chemotaxis protein
MTRRILIVEDDEATRTVMRELLSEEGFVVIGMERPPDDVAAVERLRPDAVVLDCLFYRAASGLKMLDHLKAHPNTRSIPVIICTALPKTVAEAAIA